MKVYTKAGVKLNSFINLPANIKRIRRLGVVANCKYNEAPLLSLLLNDNVVDDVRVMSERLGICMENFNELNIECTDYTSLKLVMQLGYVFPAVPLKLIIYYDE